MAVKKNIFVINGSAGRNSANEKLIGHLEKLAKDYFNFTVWNDLKTLPHFDPDLSADNPPEEIILFRNQVENADGVIISTPEYVFSIPAGLKNAIEWCVATTIFQDKPTGLLTASASGIKGSEELQLIMKTLSANFMEATTFLIPGVKGKINAEGKITDDKTETALKDFINAFKDLVNTQPAHS
jgi:NAD(P)H-dependent FMN reductase